MSDGSSLGVTAASSVNTQLGLIYNSVFPSGPNASFIGGLSANNTSINLLSQVTPQVSNDFYTFNFEQGSSIKLAFNGIVGVLGDSNNDAPGTNVDGTSVGLRFQLYDSAGNLVADSNGTPAQQAAYNSLTSSSGLTASTGTYYAQVSTTSSSNLALQGIQNYNVQLFSGTTYSNNLLYSAQTQPYDPNLFVSAASSVAVNAANLALYTNSANLSGDQASALGVGTLTPDNTELDVVSQANEQNQSAYYQFNLSQDSALKFSLNNTTALPNLAQGLRVQLYDSSGTLVADNYGTQAQKQNYTLLSSGEGLTSAAGSYVAKVSYAPGSDITQSQSYNFQFNAGTSYDTIYKTTASIPDPSAGYTTPNLGVFANSQAQLYSAQQYNQIGETASSAVEIGWLKADQSRLDLESQLTVGDKQDYYNFTLQQGNNLKLAFNNITDTASTRVQLLDQTGTQVIADNYGTPAQKAAFAALTSSTGLKASPAQYVVSVGYAPGATASATQTYNFQVYSGNTFVNSYQTLASAQTYQNAILSGNPSVVGYSAAATAASYLTNLSNGNVDANGDSTLNIISTLSATV